MEGFKVEQFLAGTVFGVAIRSTDLLPVVVGIFIGHYISTKNIDLYTTVLGLGDRFLPQKRDTEDKE